MESVKGGVCAPSGFLAAGVHCGIRKNHSKLDLGLIHSKTICAAAGVYTQNKVQGAPIAVTKNHLKSGYVHSVVCNSGVANTCAANGVQTANKMCSDVAASLHLKPEDVAVASTGVIGVSLPMDKINAGIPPLVAALSVQGGTQFAGAIMTTDTFAKEYAVSFMLGGKHCAMGGTAKGSGMIHPDMATMLGFITTDAAASPQMLQKALLEVVGKTFNMVSIDGDTSTNDTVLVLANGAAGNAIVDTDGEDYEILKQALLAVSTNLSKMLATDGEGATKLVECSLQGAPDEKTAAVLARCVISSSLVKAAMFGSDANWGRILCALGYAKAQFDISKVELSFASVSGQVLVCQNGAGIEFDEEKALSVLQESSVQILINLHQGTASALAWGCDLSYDYVKINGDYRT